jgi:hypothetical protein
MSALGYDYVAEVDSSNMLRHQGIFISYYEALTLRPPENGHRLWMTVHEKRLRGGYPQSTDRHETMQQQQLIILGKASALGRLVHGRVTSRLALPQ